MDSIIKSIFAKAFRSESVSQNLNDESAEKLLERIKMEKEFSKRSNKDGTKNKRRARNRS